MLGRGAFYAPPKAIEFKLLGAIRSMAVDGVKGTEETPTIMQGPNHWGKFQSCTYEGDWPTRTVQVVDVYNIESFLLKKFYKLLVKVII